MAIGTFAPSSSLFTSSRFIYAPSKPPLITTPSQPVQTSTSFLPPPPPRAPVIQSAPLASPTYAPQIVTTTTTSGDAFVSSATNPISSGPSAPSATGSATGNQTGSTGTTDTSRLFDLISAAFQPQDIGQAYGPQSVSSDAIQTGNGGGTNPMAVVIVAILVIAGVFLYAHRKTKKAA